MSINNQKVSKFLFSSKKIDQKSLRIYFSIQILTFMKICSENEKNFKFKYIQSV